LLVGFLYIFFIGGKCVSSVVIGNGNGNINDDTTDFENTFLPDGSIRLCIPTKIGYYSNSIKAIQQNQQHHIPIPVYLASSCKSQTVLMVGEVLYYNLMYVDSCENFIKCLYVMLQNKLQ
jgi:hypothetical protein